jgi:predicted permease
MFGLNSIYLDVRPDVRVLAFTTALCLLTGVLFGLAPALRAASESLGLCLAGRGSGCGGSAGYFPVGKLLVIAQVALSLVLLIGAGLFERTLSNLREQDLGYDREHLLLVWTVPAQTSRKDTTLASLAHEVEQRLSQVPGVLSASPSSAGLLNGVDQSLFATSSAINLEGQSPRPGLRVARSAVVPGFFGTAGMELLQGRDFGEWDKASAPPVAIINEALARFEFGDETPIGKRVGILSDVGTPRQIIGVVKDAKKYNNLRDDQLGMIYVSYRQRPEDLGTMCVVVRTAGNPLALAARVRDELRELDSNLPILKIDTIDQQLELTLIKERLLAALAEFFGILAMLLSCLGLYGVIAYRVARRTSEIGIRLALGAAPAGLLGMVLKESVWLVLAGVAIGLPVAIAVTRLIRAMLFGVNAADPLTMAGATLLMLGVAALAGSIPARRAARVDPMVALRYE